MTDVLGAASTDLGNFASGGHLEQAYLLILPPSSPAGGVAAAAAGAAGVGAEDAAGVSGSSGNSTLQAGESSLSGTVGNRVQFAFNPLQYTIEKGAEWMRFPEPGAYNAAVPMFVGSMPRSMSVEVLLDATYSSGDIQGDVDLLFSCCQPTLLSLLMEKPSPPFVIFGWGSTLGFLAFMRSVRAEYTLFKPDGTPLRASCTLSLEEIPIGLPAQNPTSGGTARRSRTIVRGDTLQSVAFKEYGKPTLWRAIADVNGIDDPTRVAPGTTLLIPPVAEAAAYA